MIRCIPVDGSAPFDVENDVSAVGVICSYRVDKLADPERGDGEDHSYLVDGKECRIESWRERAERLEAALRKIAEQDANSCRSGWRHWARIAADALGIHPTWFTD